MLWRRKWLVSTLVATTSGVEIWGRQLCVMRATEVGNVYVFPQRAWTDGTVEFRILEHLEDNV